MMKLPLLGLCPSQPLVGQGLCECVLLLGGQVVLPSGYDICQRQLLVGGFYPDLALVS